MCVIGFDAEITKCNCIEEYFGDVMVSFCHIGPLIPLNYFSPKFQKVANVLLIDLPQQNLPFLSNALYVQAKSYLTSTL